MTVYPRIPYGVADFKAIRLQNRLYVDKTRFLRELENEDYAVLLRPRRFGKSCWVSLLENYYDRTRGVDFEAVFGGTDIGADPTANRHRYVILRFNFSAFNDALETLEERFEGYCHTELRGALERNADLFPDEARQRILSPPAIDGKLNELFRYAGDHGIALYVLIDEYDHFANTVLAHRGAEAYRSFTHGGGFYRSFFATLKAGAERSDGGLERLFITGVSPITLDDVTSGFNIGRNVSLNPRFNEMLGFTEPEVRSLLEMYRELGVLDQDVDAALVVMREWYDGYRFAKGADATLYNTDMVLHYLKESIPNAPMPDELIDMNVRIDYGKLRHLLVVNRQLDGNFDLLRHLIGEERVDADPQPGFPLEQLDQRENFLSLLHYFGLLSIRDVSEGVTRLGIPNQTVKRLMYGYLRNGYRDVGVFSVDLYTFSRLMHEMAFRGAWRPVVEHLSAAIARQTGIRDYLDGEKVVHAFLAAHFSMTDYFLLHSEYELNKGYADLCLLCNNSDTQAHESVRQQDAARETVPTAPSWRKTWRSGQPRIWPGRRLRAAKARAVSRYGWDVTSPAGCAWCPDHERLEPFAARYPDIARGYVIELEYLKRSEALDESAVAEKTREAALQLRGYLADESLRRRHPSVRHIGLAIVFHGWEMAACEAVGDDPAP